jgi:hypothetical protein
VKAYFREVTPMEITGQLRKNDDNWEIVDDAGRACVLPAGSVCEVQVAGHWIRTRIEYNHQTRNYYAVEAGVLLCEGLGARVTKRSGWFI